MPRNENGKGFSLKDHLFNRGKVVYLGELLAKADPKFDADVFVKKVMTKLKRLELKERIVWIAETLEEQLPQEFEAAADVIINALPDPLDPTKTDNDFGDFIFAPLGEYVVRNGLSKKYLHTSLGTIQEITQRFSMEDAIRYFLNAFEDETLKVIGEWTSHRHYHVRRLVSEGTRPLLPWSGRINMDIDKAVPLLNELYFDNTRYVTRSVANHMNDIAKKYPDLVIKTLKRWAREGKQEPKEMDWIISHSLRTLVKEGNTEALMLLGYHAKPQIVVTDFELGSEVVSIGGFLEFSFVIVSEEASKFMIDYEIDYQKANNKRGKKVFKLKKLSLQPGDRITLSKKHLFPADATTLTFYPGQHHITLQINGVKMNTAQFELS